MTENSHHSLFFPLCEKDDFYHVLYCISVCDFLPKNFKLDNLVFCFTQLGETWCDLHQNFSQVAQSGV